MNYFSPKRFPDFLKKNSNFVGSQSFHIKLYQDILWKINLYSWNFVRFCIPKTWNSTTGIAKGKVLPCNKKVMSLTPDRDNILKTWVHVVLNLMKCILQLIGLNKLKGQYTYICTYFNFFLRTFFSMHVHCTCTCSFFYFKFEFKMPDYIQKIRYGISCDFKQFKGLC